VSKTANLKRAELHACEEIIERGQRTFVEVGRALGRIRDERLYREDGYSSFDDYCKARWSMAKSYANYLIAGTEVATNVAITNEAQARALRQVPEPRRADVLADVRSRSDSTGQPVSARLIEEVSTGAPRGATCTHCEIHCPGPRYRRELEGG
jgi:hypothetical protein